jgi:hypothetical protein
VLFEAALVFLEFFLEKVNEALAARTVERSRRPEMFERWNPVLQGH